MQASVLGLSTLREKEKKPVEVSAQAKVLQAYLASKYTEGMLQDGLLVVPEQVLVGRHSPVRLNAEGCIAYQKEQLLQIAGEWSLLRPGSLSVSQAVAG